MNKINVNRLLRIQPSVLTDKEVGNHFILVREQINLYNPAIPYKSQLIRAVYMEKRRNVFIFKNVETSEMIVYPNNEIKDIFRDVLKSDLK
jgi:hypothetical protein